MNFRKEKKITFISIKINYGLEYSTVFTLLILTIETCSCFFGWWNEITWKKKTKQFLRETLILKTLRQLYCYTGLVLWYSIVVLLVINVQQRNYLNIFSLKFDFLKIKKPKIRKIYATKANFFNLNFTDVKINFSRFLCGFLEVLKSGHNVQMA